MSILGYAPFYISQREMFTVGVEIIEK